MGLSLALRTDTSAGFNLARILSTSQDSGVLRAVTSEPCERDWRLGWEDAWVEQFHNSRASKLHQKEKVESGRQRWLRLAHPGRGLAARGEEEEARPMARSEAPGAGTAGGRGASGSPRRKGSAPGSGERRARAAPRAGPKFPAGGAERRRPSSSEPAGVWLPPLPGGEAVFLPPAAGQPAPTPCSTAAVLAMYVHCAGGIMAPTAVRRGEGGLRVG